MNAPILDQDFLKPADAESESGGEGEGDLGRTGARAQAPGTEPSCRPGRQGLSRGPGGSGSGRGGGRLRRVRRGKGTVIGLSARRRSWQY